MKLRKTTDGFEVLDSVGDPMVRITSGGEMYTPMWRKLNTVQEEHMWNWISRQAGLPFELEVLIPFDEENPFGVGQGVGE